MKTIEQWLEEYGENHLNKTNKLIHWICVPAIFFSITGLLYAVDLHLVLVETPITLAHVALILAIAFYVMLSPSLAIGMAIIGLLCLTICHAIEMIGLSTWKVSLIIFVVAWIGQFIGHKIEGKKPSFLTDLQFLLIGPAWLMSFVYKKMGIGI